MSPGPTLAPGADGDVVESDLRTVFPVITRLTLDRIERVADAAAFGDTPSLADQR